LLHPISSCSALFVAGEERDAFEAPPIEAAFEAASGRLGKGRVAHLHKGSGASTVGGA